MCSGSAGIWQLVTRGLCSHLFACLSGYIQINIVFSFRFAEGSGGSSVYFVCLRVTVCFSRLSDL